MKKIIVMGGSFNPPTIAHQKLLLAAVRELNAAKGIFVPSSHAYVKTKMRRAGHPEETLSESLRLEMLNAMAADDSRLAVDDLEYHRKERGYTYETMVSLRAKYPDAELYFLAGGDKVEVFPRWHRIREFLDSFHIIVVRRDGSDPATEIAANPFLSQYRTRFSVISAPEGMDGVSSTAIREKLRAEESGAEEMCHPGVWRLLTENGGMGKRIISCFRKEYSFLSNFWEVPVEYQGLVYGSNEAAFQAQKCQNREEMVSFTTLRPSDAKRKGRRVSLRPDWEQVKVGVMEDLVRAKFTQNEDLKQLLLATGDAILEEGNTWHDTFWGVDAQSRKGENHLGKILMKIRRELSR